MKKLHFTGKWKWYEARRIYIQYFPLYLRNIIEYYILYNIFYTIFSPKTSEHLLQKNWNASRVPAIKEAIFIIKNIIENNWRRKRINYTFVLYIFKRKVYYIIKIVHIIHNTNWLLIDISFYKKNTKLRTCYLWTVYILFTRRISNRYYSIKFNKKTILYSFQKEKEFSVNI